MMGRSGYTDDGGAGSFNLWRGTVSRSIQGKRGQKFLREMAEALDAMETKELIAGELQTECGVCALGSVGTKRGIDMTKIDPEGYSELGKMFDVSSALIQEIEYVNDEEGDWYCARSPAERWVFVRKWVAKQIGEEWPSPVTKDVGTS